MAKEKRKKIRNRCSKLLTQGYLQDLFQGHLYCVETQKIFCFEHLCMN